MSGLPPPPIQDAPGSFTWLEWYRQLRAYISTSGSVPWSVIDFAGSNITDITSRAHSNLQGIQGGTTGEYYHITSAQNTTLSNITDGTYTPSLTNETNLTASTAYLCSYTRIGSTVTVTGMVDVDPTVTGACVLRMSLPIASNFAAVSECTGVAANNQVAGFSAAIIGDVGNDEASFRWTATDTANRALSFTFTYRVI